MAMTIKAYFREIPQNERELVKVSDEIWSLGSIEDIKEKVSPELFIAHVGMNIIGNWQSDGWESIISYHPDLFPYIPQALDAIGQPEIKEAFRNVIALFPEFVSLRDGGADVNALYGDMINFLTNVSFKVEDERLNQYSKEERARLSKEYNSRMEILENLSDPLLSWDGVLNYIKAEYNS